MMRLCCNEVTGIFIAVFTIYENDLSFYVVTMLVGLYTTIKLCLIMGAKNRDEASKKKTELANQSQTGSTQFFDINT